MVGLGIRRGWPTRPMWAGPSTPCRRSGERATLETELAAVTAQFDALVAADPEWARQRTAKALAALVGAAPFTQQSGRGRATAAIGGGRRHVRSDRWLPTLTAMRGTPGLAAVAAVADRVRSQGTPPSVVVIACMHNLLTIRTAMVRDNTTWEERPVAAEPVLLDTQHRWLRSALGDGWREKRWWLEPTVA